jgi:uncharacterized protein (TIGR02118 family)
MKTVFATFNFKGSDVATAERHYLENHVRLTLALPNLRQYITGRIRPDLQHPMPYRAAFNYFDGEAELRWALKSPAAKPLLQDGAAHLRVNRWLELDSEIIVPFDSKQPGMPCLVLVMEFELKLNGISIEEAEQHYRKYHVDMARRLPNLRHYMISIYQVSRKFAAMDMELPLRNPLRMAVLLFDNWEALRDAYQSPVGRELKKHAESDIANARVYRIDATVQR